MIKHGVVCVLYTISLSLTASQSYIARTVSQLNAISAEPLCSFIYDTHLASIHNDAEMIEASSLCSTNDCWIGLHDTTTEDIFQWIDGSVFDYGTNINGGIAPWNTGEPNDYQAAGGEDCVIISSYNNKWDDKHCQNAYRDGILCNYPSPIYVFKDNTNYERIPWFSKPIAMIDILDEIYIEFRFNINSFTSNDYSNIIHIGSNDMTRSPGIWLYEPTKSLLVQTTAISTQSSYFILSPNALNTNQWYNVSVYLKQDHFTVILDNDIIYDQDIASHQILMDQNIYLGDPWYIAADVIVSGLIISTSNTYYNPNNDAFFNYLCDFNDRFTIKAGAWSENGCILSKNDEGAGNMVWLGEKDISSLNWVNYKVEIVYTIHSGEDAGLLIRTISVGPNNNDGQYYNIHIHIANQKIIFAKISYGTFDVLYEYTDTSIFHNVEFRLRVEAISDEFYVFFQDKYIFNVIDTSYGSGSVGLRNYFSTATYKSMRITFPTDNYLLTVNPTPSPTNIPSISPTNIPSISPSESPSSVSPTNVPSSVPSETPSKSPSNSPITSSPTKDPTLIPTKIPTLGPTLSPTLMNESNSYKPTQKQMSGQVTESMDTTKNGDNSNGNTVKSNTNILNVNVAVFVLLVFTLVLFLIICVLSILLYRKRRRIHRQKTDENHININPKLNEPGSNKHSIIIDNDDNTEHIKMDKKDHIKIELEKVTNHEIQNNEFSSSSSDDELFDVVSSTDNNTTTGTTDLTPNRTPNA